MVELNARAVMAPAALAPTLAPVGAIGRYLHPYLTLGPKGAIVLAKGPSP